jgi:hypothetical protein
VEGNADFPVQSFPGGSEELFELQPGQQICEGAALIRFQIGYRNTVAADPQAPDENLVGPGLPKLTVQAQALFVPGKGGRPAGLDFLNGNPAIRWKPAAGRR